MKKNFVITICLMLEAVLIFGPFQSFRQQSAAKAAADNGVIAYVRSMDGREDQIHLIDPDGQNDRHLWSTGDIGFQTGLRIVKNLAWKPDGSELAFDSSHQGSCSQYGSDIYTIRTDGSHLRRIPNKPGCDQNTGLPTGTVVVTFANYSDISSPFVLYFEGAPAAQSYAIPNGTSLTVTFNNVVDYGDTIQWAVAIWGGVRFLALDGGADVIPGQTVEVYLVMGAGYEGWALHSPTWNYDGSQIAYIFMDDTNPYGVPAGDLPLGAEGSHLLVSDNSSWSLPLDDRFLAYGPTQALSDQLLYAGYNPAAGDGGDHIYMETVGQMEPGEIVINSSDLNGDGFRGLAWLPDGSGFVFSMEEDFTQRANIFRYSFSTGQSTRLTDYPASSWTRELSVSPDGTQIVYSLQTQGEYWWDNPPMDLYLMNIDGSNNRLLVADGHDPDWGVGYVAPDNPVPTLNSISPSLANAGGAGFSLTASGSSFVSDSVVRWNGVDLPTVYVDATTLTAQVPAEKIATAGTASVTVFNPAPAGGTSGGKTFTINKTTINNPVPVLTSLSRTSIIAGGGSFVLTISGSNFISGSVVRWNGIDLPTTYVSAVTLTVQVPAAQIAASGTASVSVFNPAPGGGKSTALSFIITKGLIKVYLPMVIH